ncbi:MAG TPA: efflux RND transporter periplasmic adaptor subunit [Candidatus Angelobacter sp.]|nr:efflux RND transporter periplasmic adaptor subunit [Candidatus Angelobacter sp.]
MAGLCLAAAACCSFSGCSKGEKEPTAEVSVQASVAQKSDISRVITAEAVVFPIQQSAITPKINAPVKRFLVNRGQKVQKGQLLAVLENRDLSAAAVDNQGAFDQAQATYETSVKSTLPGDFEKAQLDFDTAGQELDAQEKLYASREDLFKQGALPRKDLDQAKVSLTQARSAYNLAKQHLDALNAGGKQQAMRSASGQLQSAKGKLMGAQASLSYSEIRSPIEGYITDRPLYPGEMASTSTPLLTVMDTSKIIAKAHIPQSDAMLLRKGDKAAIEVTGGEDKIAGTVTLVSPALDPSSTTVEIWVQAANPKQQLRPGTTVKLSMNAQTVPGALVIPAAALLNANGDTAQVMVIDAQSVAQSRDVKTGIQNDQNVQIVEGLKPGDQVVTQGAYGLPDKTKVKVEKPGAGEAAGDAGKADKGND